MRRILLALTLSLTATWAAAQDVLSPNPDIEATISGQFNAFVAEDVNTAWTYASPNIQRLFQTPDNFARMVQQGYPMVWDPRAFEFVDLQQLGAMIIQRVQVTDQSGTVHMFGYQMIETENGWRINGVQPLRMPELGA
ncbi:MAG: DUF4864 domain-containing protein [Pseudomonadota bacterium]